MSSPSFERLNYLLRPSKQVERKIIIEVLQHLTRYQYDIGRYRYVGLGSIYYVDFALFHNHLYIDDMLCVELEEIERRMRLNKPYDFIKLHMGPVSEVLPELQRARRHLIWLDYDKPLTTSMLTDMTTALSIAAPGSIVLATVAAQLSQVERAANVQEQLERSRALAAEYTEIIGQLVSGEIKGEMLNRKNFAPLLSSALRRHFHDTVTARRDADLEFVQLFNYRYSDGMVMFTYGGIIERPRKAERLRKSRLFRRTAAELGSDPLVISVPHLTVREKHWLDQHVATKLTPRRRIAFEIERAEVENFARFHRYYPLYHESLM